MGDILACLARSPPHTCAALASCASRDARAPPLETSAGMAWQAATVLCVPGVRATRRDRLLSAPGEKGRVVHRLAVFDVTGEIKHILSHLDIIR